MNLKNYLHVQKLTLLIGLIFFGGWLLFFGGSPVEVLLSATLTPPALPMPATLPPPALPMPTAFLEPAVSSLTLDSRPEHGRPPYTTNLQANLYSPSADCQHLVWDFGDGQQETQPCPAGDTPFQISHTYPNPATYHVHLRLQYTNGQTLDSNSHTIVVATPQPPVLAQVTIKWLLYLLTVGLAGWLIFWLSHRPYRRVSYGLLALLLLTFMPPFSYLPNPAGLVWRLWGSYSYDPRLPYVNRFVAAGDPTAILSPYLDGLIGQTGLDPLDPASPLSRYDFVGVTINHTQALVNVRFTYQDGNQRTYPVPLYQPQTFWGFFAHRWWYDGLGRLRTEELPLPTAPPNDQLLGQPAWLATIPGRSNTADWFQNSFINLLTYSENGILLKIAEQNDHNELWLIDPAGQPAQRIAQDVSEYRFTPDGQAIIFSRAIYQQTADGQLLTRFEMATPEGDSQVWLELPNFPLPDLGRDGAWYLADGSLWHKPYSEEPPGRIISLPGSDSGWGYGGRVRLSADGQQVAYTCQFEQDVNQIPRYNLCLAGIDGQNWRELPLSAVEMDFSWNPAGSILAVVQWGYEEPTLLTLVRGDAVTTITLAPDGPAGTPQWLPNGQQLWINAFPWGGRRILQVVVDSGRVTDLTPSRWDAYFALAPNGQNMVISSGRGNLWLLPLP